MLFNETLFFVRPLLCILQCILIQIQMLGYDISWAGFNIIEVMSSSKFTHKRIGYLAASQCFHADSEVSVASNIE